MKELNDTHDTDELSKCSSTIFFWGEGGGGVACPLMVNKSVLNLWIKVMNSGRVSGYVPI